MRNMIFAFFAGNSDEALSTHSGKPGAEDYSLRENMEKAVRILKKRAEEKHAKMFCGHLMLISMDFSGIRQRNHGK